MISEATPVDSEAELRDRVARLESDVTLALEMLLSATAPITVAAVKALIASTSDVIQVPMLEQPMPDLAAYDQLLTQAVA